jgi:ferritin-like metal-binding protein YciE
MPRKTIKVGMMDKEHFDKLCDLLDDLDKNPHKYNSWETDFISSFEINGSIDERIELTEKQIEKLDELFEKHIDEGREILEC